MQSDATHDLGWLAFRYISNEMTQAEMEAFERRLAEDQSAREAVAQAVDWTRALAEVPQEVVPLRQRAPARKMRWLVAAASLAAGVMVYQSARHALELKTLAKVWAKHMGQETFNGGDGGLFAGSDDLMSIDEDADLTVPSWMIEAVGGFDSDKWEDI